MGRRASQRGSIIEGLNIDELAKMQTKLLESGQEELIKITGNPSPGKNLRRRNTTLQAQGTSLVDTGVEIIITEGLGHPPCCKLCEQTDLGQFLMKPTDHALRHKRTSTVENNEDDVVVKNGALPRYGFKDFYQAGYQILNRSEAKLVDEKFALQLHLQVAVHRKTSVERYVWTAHKPKITITPQQLKQLVRILLRCCHINIVQLVEVVEDANNVYFLYEYCRSITLDTRLEDDTPFLESEMADIACHCGAAFHFAHSMQLYHLGISLHHVWLPPGGKGPSKVFGFGLAGAFRGQAGDKKFWSKEVAQTYIRNKENYLQKLEEKKRSMSDMWSLGVVTYHVVARFGPFHSGYGPVVDMIVKGKFNFSPAFENLDDPLLAKGLMDAHFAMDGDTRITHNEAYQHGWIKATRTKHFRPEVEYEYRVLHDFVIGTKAKKLFGRFLTKFLSDEQRCAIARRFSILDAKGDGVLDEDELQDAADLCPDKGKLTVKQICQWFDVGENLEQKLSVSQFYESLAEEIIDGVALRHAFEFLDQDGSEEITAEELHKVLQTMDESISLEEVVEHIRVAEMEAGAEGKVIEAEANNDETLGFDEFQLLFPLRVQKMVALRSRVVTAKQQGEKYNALFYEVKQPVDKFISKLDADVNELIESGAKMMSKNVEALPVAKAIEKHCKNIDKTLSNPPGAEFFDAKWIKKPGNQKFLNEEKKKPKKRI